MNCNSNTCGCETAPADRAATTTTPTFVPAADIADLGAEYTLTADLPGCTPESVDVSFEEGVLTIKGSPVARGPSGDNYLRREYGVGGFHRQFRLGEDVDVEQIGAEYKDGVLTVRLPKAKAAGARKVAIRTA